MTKPSASWVIINKATGNAVMETFNRRYAEAVNNEKYQAVPVLEYLHGLNRKIKEKAAW